MKKPECKCSIPALILGNGCQICNPDYYNQVKPKKGGTMPAKKKPTKAAKKKKVKKAVKTAVVGTMERV
jgi:hypothetical protein